MLRGGTPFTYFLANYSAEFVALLLMGLTVWLFISLTHTSMGLYIVPITMWATAEPLFLHFWKTLLYTRLGVSRRIFLVGMFLLTLVAQSTCQGMEIKLKDLGPLFDKAYTIT
jgi:hypothetical protein